MARFTSERAAPRLREAERAAKRYGEWRRPVHRTGRRPLFFIWWAMSESEMIESLKRKLGGEVERLQHELSVTLPGEIRRAVEMGDLRENSEYKAALERQQFIQARLGQLRQRLSKLSQIDVALIPADRVGLGSRVVVLEEQQSVTETFHLVFGDAEEFEEGQVTMSSPIGRSLVGKSVGDEVTLRLPNSVRRLKIVELQTIHQ